MEAGCKNLVPLVDGGELRLAHDGELLHEAEPAAVGGGVVVGVGGQGPPLDVERVVAILEAPDMTSQTGVDPFGTVFEAGGTANCQSGGEVPGLQHLIPGQGEYNVASRTAQYY